MSRVWAAAPSCATRPRYGMDGPRPWSPSDRECLQNGYFVFADASIVCRIEGRLPAMTVDD